jgi:DoxX-like family
MVLQGLAAQPEYKPMSTDLPQPAESKALLWIGRVLSALPVLMLLPVGVMMFLALPDVVKSMAPSGYTPKSVHFIGAALLLSTILYAIPRTAVLGAILLTGYLGGAVATHVVKGEPWFAPVIFGVVIWLGLVLRDARLRSVLPWRK